MTDLYFAGTEQKMWRELLQREGVEHVSLSYIGLLRRIRNPSKWRIADHYPGQKVFLDSGCHTLNKKDDTDPDEAQKLASAYMDFVEANLDAIAFAAEFDATVLGPSMIAYNRGEFWDQLRDDKWLPIWHPEYGLKMLEDMARTYTRVGVLQGDTSSDLTPILRKLAGQTMLHGVAMTKMQLMQDIPWSSVGSTSWLSPTQYGDTFVWDGRQMHRYPKSEKEKSRKRHRLWLASQGFDMDLIEADDNNELLRLSIWSWRNFAASLKKGSLVTPMNVLSPFGNEEPTPDIVDTPGTSGGNAELVPRAERKLLPVLGITYEKGTDKDGNDIAVEHLTTPSKGLLRCDTCFMREQCPEAKPGAECAYEIPAQIRTASQLAAVQDWLIETQTQRVAFMRLVEQAQGGYADANLTSEMMHLQRMIKAKTDAGKDGININIANVAAPGGPGMIARIFGNDTAEKMSALPAPIDAQDIVEAELVPERSN